MDFVPTLIKRITPTGIETVDGNHQDLDVIVCATGTTSRFITAVYFAHAVPGFDTSFRSEFPLIGRDGVDINEKYTPHPKV